MFKKWKYENGMEDGDISERKLYLEMLKDYKGQDSGRNGMAPKHDFDVDMDTEKK